MLIDHGISHGLSGTPDALPTAPLTALDLATRKPDGTVDDAEQDFINRTNKAKSKIAYDFSVTGRTILLRDGPFPISGKAAAIGYLNSNEGTWTWTPRLRGASVANDLAFVVGNCAGKTIKGEKQNGHYVRLWVRDAGGEAPLRWTLAAEMLAPPPPPKP